MTHHPLLKEAIETFQAGDRARARALLAEAVAADPHHEPGWLWYAYLQESAARAIAVLQQALQLHPEWDEAQRRLRIYQARAEPQPGQGERSLAGRLAQARTELLDLSLRNPLLNYRLLRARGVALDEPDAERVFDALVVQGRALAFAPAEDDALAVQAPLEGLEEGEDALAGDAADQGPVAQAQASLPGEQGPDGDIAAAGAGGGPPVAGLDLDGEPVGVAADEGARSGMPVAAAGAGPDAGRGAGPDVGPGAGTEGTDGGAAGAAPGIAEARAGAAPLDRSGKVGDAATGVAALAGPGTVAYAAGTVPASMDAAAGAGPMAAGAPAAQGAGDVPNGDVPTGDAPNGDVPHGDAPHGAVASDAAANGRERARTLRTIHPPADLDKRLRNTYYIARTYMEEQGVNALFLAFGMLQWVDPAEPATAYRAPLVLVPVELSRTDVRSRFRIRYTEDELGDNLSLRAKLRETFRLELPPFPELDDFRLGPFLAQAAHAVSMLKGWSVDRDAIALGFFSFGTFLMYNDLLEETWEDVQEITAHPIVNALLGQGFRDAAPGVPDDAFIDDLVDPQQTHYVLDADSTQIGALLEAGKGRNLVIQGPPGTGKSQTITNLIAEAIGEGKRVLFVAEKMAALEVVKRRLDTIGLGDACLELHSQKTNKRAVVTELQRTFNLGEPHVREHAVNLDLLVQQRDRLNAYSRAVNTPIGQSAVTVYACYGHLLRLGRAMASVDVPDLACPVMRRWDYAAFAHHRVQVGELQSLVASIGVPREHPFWACDPPSLTPAGRRAFEQKTAGALAALADLVRAAGGLTDHLGLPPAESRHETLRLERLAQRLAAAPDLTGVDVTPLIWASSADTLLECIRAAQRLEALHAQHDATLRPEAWEHEIAGVRRAYVEYGGSFWRGFSGEFREARKALAALCVDKLPRGVERQRALVLAIDEAQRLAQQIARSDALLRRLFGGAWIGPHRDWARLETVTLWLAALHRDVALADMPPGIVTYLARALDRGFLRQAGARLARALATHQAAGEAVRDEVRLDEGLRFGEGLQGSDGLRFGEGARSGAAPPNGEGARAAGTLPYDDAAASGHAALAGDAAPVGDASPVGGGPAGLPPEGVRPDGTGPAEQVGLIWLPYGAQQALLEAWAASPDRIQEIVTYNDRARQLREAELGGVVDVAARWPAAGRHLVHLFERTWYEDLLDVAIARSPELATFEGDAHTRCVQLFRELDRRQFDYNRARLAALHWRHLPRSASDGQMGILKREFEKKRRHYPIRKLMQTAGNAVQGLKPVFMMSPLSVAMYLPPGSVTFDLVVFDEASQVKPADAFGALLRGRQAVVTGDQKQLPPTSFFEQIVVASEEEDESPTADMESILGLFAAQGAPQKMLRWHYRSRHESLIAVSNYQFYENGLVVFPSPDRAREDIGLFFHHLPGTHYDRGKSATNRGEARIVAQAVMAHARERPHLTLGVAAFSVGQSNEIQDQLERLRRQDPSYEAFFNSHPHEPFFVKNLENVQGDERDVIFISVGYGRTAEGNVAMAFGPLNNEGGERRLNVLITRARYRCEVFSNITSDDIDLRRTQAPGVVALKRFLKYAQTADLDLPTASGRGPESPFEADVMAVLRERGYLVEPQVGSAGFTIDLAVVDGRRPGRYLLGIECDGATYHRARSARDRDRLRQEVLEGLGWRIHRIWSTDWFNHREREIDRLMGAIEQALLATPAGSLPGPAGSTANPGPGAGQGGVPAARATTHTPAADARTEHADGRTAHADGRVPPADGRMPPADGRTAQAGLPTAPTPRAAAPRSQPASPAPRAGTGPRAATLIRRAETRTNAAATQIQPYRQAELTLRLGGRAFHEVRPSQMASWVARVVEVEGPVSPDLLVYRLCRAAGVGRAGSRIQRAISQGIAHAERAAKVVRRGRFIWPRAMARPPVRDRSALPVAQRKIELVAPEEIAEAVVIVVGDAMGMAEAEIPRAVARLLGFGRSSDALETAVARAVAGLRESGALAEQGDSLVLGDVERPDFR